MTAPRYPSVHVQVPHGESDEVAAALFSLGATGVEERDATTLDKNVVQGSVTLVAHFEDEDRARIVVEALPYPASLVPIVGDDWKHRWREFFKPSRVGARFLVRPPWEAIEPGVEDVVLTIDPGQAFGTGTHETTRLVLAELERVVQGGERALDVGCGSGILSIGALLLGAERAEGVDIDDESMQASHENAALNGVAGRLTVSQRRVEKMRGAFPLVLANIESRVLVPLSKPIAARVAAGGTLILSGLLSHEEDELVACYEALGLQHQRTGREKDWITLVFTRPAAKKSAAKKSVAKKSAAKKSAAKKSAAKKSAAKKPSR